MVANARSSNGKSAEMRDRLATVVILLDTLERGLGRHDRSQDLIEHLMMASPIYAGSSLEEDRKLIELARQQLEADGDATRGRAIVSLRRKGANSSFFLATELCFADPDLDENHMHFLTGLGEQLEVDEAFMKSVLEVAELRRRCLNTIGSIRQLSGDRVFCDRFEGGL
jgi:hypothetical protein